MISLACGLESQGGLDPFSFLPGCSWVDRPTLGIARAGYSYVASMYIRRRGSVTVMLTGEFSEIHDFDQV